jgi:coenzyme F420-0:L-glutamate ligase/coenzyme F420-1:gamma-L-glutamate ligase
VARAALEFHALAQVPEVAAGADLAALVAMALERAALTLRAGDVVVVAQKIVSKAEGRWRKLVDVEPTAEAQSVAARCGKDPRLVELVLQESSAVVRVAPNVLITRHRLGYVMANAGIDHSNTGRDPHDETVLLLPEEPDASARRLRSALLARLGIAPGVIVSDSFGRPWRLGTVNVALGVAGLPALIDLRGAPDRDGRKLQMTQVAVADALAAGAGVAMGEGTEGTPIVLVRGYAAAAAACNDGQALIRSVDEDLFR